MKYELVVATTVAATFAFSWPLWKTVSTKTLKTA
jgi:hypothetical protein